MQKEHMVIRVTSLFPKRWPLSNLDGTENNLPKHEMKRHGNAHLKLVTENQNRNTALERSVINYRGLVPHDNFHTRQ